MEKRLQQLFDYQRFEENARLSTVINSVKARYNKRELNEDDLEWVAAAGNPDLLQPINPLGRIKLDDR